MINCVRLRREDAIRDGHLSMLKIRDFVLDNKFAETIDLDEDLFWEINWEFGSMVSPITSIMGRKLHVDGMPLNVKRALMMV